MIDSGFSCPSMMPCDNAVYTSPNAIGTGLAPSAFIVSITVFVSGTRILSPLKSAGAAIARLLFVVFR